MDMQPDDDHLDFSDLPTLPPEQIRVLGHIIRNPDIRQSEIIAAFDESSDGEAITADALSQILRILVKQRLLNISESDGDITYRARMRRKTSQVMTIQGIWKALDADGDGLESEMHGEMRRARSDLANSLLADMSKQDQYDFNQPPEDPEQARQTGQTLLSDLTNAGRSSMSKREGTKDHPDKKPESRGRILQDDIAAEKASKVITAEHDQVLDELAAKLRKQTGIHPVVKVDDEKPGLWRKLKGWLGADD
jgi:DNA-binding MarR family transcriptional regulator